MPKVRVRKVVICLNCGAEHPLSKKFCDNCGSPLHPVAINVDVKPSPDSAVAALAVPSENEAPAQAITPEPIVEVAPQAQVVTAALDESPVTATAPEPENLSVVETKELTTDEKITAAVASSKKELVEMFAEGYESIVAGLEESLNRVQNGSSEDIWALHLRLEEGFKLLGNVNSENRRMLISHEGRLLVFSSILEGRLESFYEDLMKDLPGPDPEGYPENEYDRKDAPERPFSFSFRTPPHKVDATEPVPPWRLHPIQEEKPVGVSSSQPDEESIHLEDLIHADEPQSAPAAQSDEPFLVSLDQPDDQLIQVDETPSMVAPETDQPAVGSQPVIEQKPAEKEKIVLTGPRKWIAGIKAHLNEEV